MATGSEILRLYDYFFFAADMRARFIKSDEPSFYSVSGGAVPEKAIVSGLYDRASIAGLYAVVEGWNEIGLNKPVAWEESPYAGVLAHHQAEITKLLSSRTGAKTTVKVKGGVEHEVDETFEILLKRARHKIFHFEIEHVPKELRRFHMEAEAPGRRWPQQLHDLLVVFFAAWFQSQPKK